MPDAASPVRLCDADGREVEGWAVRRDLVVARCSGLRQPVTVTLPSHETTSLAVYERTVQTDGDNTWTAVVLPEGSLPLAREHVPPGFERLTLSAASWRSSDSAQKEGAGTHRPDAPAQVTRSLWCMLFPRASGC